jgi:hypothetical protein
LSRWGHAAGLDHKSRASASCYASSGCGGPPFSRHGCCGVVRRPSLDERLVALSLATGLVFAHPSPRLRCLSCRLCLWCWCTSPEVLALGRVRGWRLRGSSTPFLGFLGHLLLRDRGSVVPVFVGLSLAFVAAHGVEADGVFPTSNSWFVSYYSRKTPLRGGRRCFSGRCGYYTEFL